MSVTASGSGDALPVQAATGPPLAGPAEQAMALSELAAAQDRVTRMKDKVAKAQRQAKELTDTAAEGLAVAEGELDDALDAAKEITGVADEAALGKLADDLAAETRRHDEAMAALAAAAQDGGK